MLLLAPPKVAALRTLPAAPTSPTTPPPPPTPFAAVINVPGLSSFSFIHGLIVGGVALALFASFLLPSAGGGGGAAGAPGSSGNNGRASGLDPELEAALKGALADAGPTFHDPQVHAAIEEVRRDVGAIAKYKDNPAVMSAFAKLLEVRRARQRRARAGGRAACRGRRPSRKQRPPRVLAKPGEGGGAGPPRPPPLTPHAFLRPSPPPRRLRASWSACEDAPAAAPICTPTHSPPARRPRCLVLAPSRQRWRSRRGPCPACAHRPTRPTRTRRGPRPPPHFIRTRPIDLALPLPHCTAAAPPLLRPPPPAAAAAPRDALPAAPPPARPRPLRPCRRAAAADL
jgi:hypothetical protein